MEKQRTPTLENDDIHIQDTSNTNPEDTEHPPSEGSTTPKEDGGYITGFKLYIIIAACTVATFLMLLDTSIVATAIPRITNDFHSLDDIGWYGTSYLLASCAVQPLSGKICNLFPAKFVFMSFLAVFEFGSLLSAVAVSSNMLIVGRAVTGIGGSGLLNAGLTIMRACVPMEKSAAYLGFLMAFAQLGILLGPLIGGVLTEFVSWRWCFYINLPIGFLVILSLFFIHIPDRRPASEVKHGLPAILHSFDLPGFAIFACTAIMFLFALSWGGTKYAWNSPTVIGLFCGSAASLLLFGGWEYKRGDTAMLPLSMLRQRIVWMSCVNYLFLSANMLVTSYYMAIYFQAVRGKTPTVSGVYMLPSVLSQMLFAVTSGILVTRWGYYLPWAVLSGIFLTVGTGLLSTLGPHSATVKWVLYQMISGAGRGCGLQMPIVAVQNHLPTPLISTGLAAVVFAQQFGPAIFISLAQTVFSTTLTSNLHSLSSPNSTAAINATTIISAGATGFRDIVGQAEIGGVVGAYSGSVKNVFYLITGAGGAAFLSAWGMGWRSVRKPKVEDGGSEGAEEKV